MRRLVPILAQEITHVVRECVKWTLVSVVLILCMWFLTDGLPRLAVTINGQTSARGIHSTSSQLDLQHHFRNSGGA